MLNSVRIGQEVLNDQLGLCHNDRFVLELMISMWKCAFMLNYMLTFLCLHAAVTFTVFIIDLFLFISMIEKTHKSHSYEMFQ